MPGGVIRNPCVAVLLFARETGDSIALVGIFSKSHLFLCKMIGFGWQEIEEKLKVNIEMRCL